MSNDNFLGRLAIATKEEIDGILIEMKEFISKEPNKLKKKKLESIRKLYSTSNGEQLPPLKRRTHAITPIEFGIEEKKEDSVGSSFITPSVYVAPLLTNSNEKTTIKTEQQVIESTVATEQRVVPENMEKMPVLPLSLTLPLSPVSKPLLAPFAKKLKEVTMSLFGIAPVITADPQKWIRVMITNVTRDLKWIDERSSNAPISDVYWVHENLKDFIAHRKLFGPEIEELVAAHIEGDISSQLELLRIELVSRAKELNYIFDLSLHY